jgi:hypothetical protein
VLVGWGETGARPEFDVVTGVSSGALLAPFAFIGADGDAALRELWAEGAAQDLGRSFSLPGLFSGEGLVEREPLERLLEAYVDEALIAEVAAPPGAPRRLLVVTTNLDAQRPVLWNLGAIAASGQPGSAELIRSVLLASASVPIAFGPVLIEAESRGVPLREMHVDGGTSSQIFAFPDAALVWPDRFSVPAGREARLWLLVNYIIEPEFAVTPLGPVGVGQRAYGSLIKSDLRSELFTIVDAARETGFEPRLASIHRVVPWNPRDPFSPEFMATLFALGRDEARAGVAFGQGS